MNKNNNTQSTLKNLLSDINFIDSLKFEANYAQKVKGGHLPHYIGIEKIIRLVSPVNLLLSNEIQNIVKSNYISKN